MKITPTLGLFLLLTLGCTSALSSASPAQQFTLPDWEAAVDDGFVVAISAFSIASGDVTFDCSANLKMLSEWRPINPGFTPVCPSIGGCNRAIFYREAQAQCGVPQYPISELRWACRYPTFSDDFAERIASPPRGQRPESQFLMDFGLKTVPADFGARGPFRLYRVDAANQIWGLDDSPDTWIKIGRGMIADIVERLDDGYCEIQNSRGKAARDLQAEWDAALEISERTFLGPYWAPGNAVEPTAPRSTALLRIRFRPASATPRIRRHVAGDRLEDASGFEITGSVTVGVLGGLDSQCRTRSGCLLPVGWATGAFSVDGAIEDTGWQRWGSDLRAYYSLRIKPDGDGWQFRPELKTGNPVRRETAKDWDRLVPGSPFSYSLKYGDGRVVFAIRHAGRREAVEIAPAIELSQFPKRDFFAVVLGSTKEKSGPEVQFPEGSRITASLRGTSN